MLGQLVDGPGLLGGLQGDLGLEGGRMPLACAGHDAPRDGTVTFDQFNIPSGPVLGVHYMASAFTSPEQEPTPAAGIERIDGTRFSNVRSISRDPNTGDFIIAGQVFPPDGRIAVENEALLKELREAAKEIEGRIEKGGLSELEQGMAADQIRVLNLQLAAQRENPNPLNLLMC